MKSLSLLTTMIVLSASPVFAEPWDASNNPSNFNRIAGINVITGFESLPTSGKLADDRLGWSESYWPSFKGGISYRWNHPNPNPFKYALHTKAELLNFSSEQMAQLSPSELYDISNNDYNYTLTKRARNLYSPRDLWWEGICHGWAQAAINFPEPEPVVLTNQDGIKVPFGSSDVKALLAMHDSYNFKGEKFGFVGRRCSVNGKVVGEGDDRDRPEHRQYPSEEMAESAECRDVNAGALHVVLGNLLGHLGQGFVADIDRFNDVWNQPIVGYKSQIMGDETVSPTHQANGISRRVRIKTDMMYGEELKFYTPELAAEGHLNFVSKKPVTLTKHQKTLTKHYEYIVEINSAGQVTGGEWVSQTRPDFLWMFGRSKQFKAAPVNMTHLKHIYRPLRR